MLTFERQMDPKSLSVKKNGKFIGFLQFHNEARFEIWADDGTSLHYDELLSLTHEIRDYINAMKFTFKKQPKAQGLARVGRPYASVSIKYLGKTVGNILAPNYTTKDGKWGIQIAVKTRDNFGWDWVYPEKDGRALRFESEEAAREYVKNDLSIFLGSSGLYLHQFEND